MQTKNKSYRLVEQRIIKELCKNKITYVDLPGIPSVRIAFFLIMFFLSAVIFIFLIIVGQWNWHDAKLGIIFIGFCLSWGLWILLIKQSNTVEFDFKNKIISIEQNRPILSLVYTKINFNYLTAIELVIIPTEHDEYFSLRLKSSGDKSITFGFFETQSEALEQIFFLKKKIKYNTSKG